MSASVIGVGGAQAENGSHSLRLIDGGRPDRALLRLKLDTALACLFANRIGHAVKSPMLDPAALPRESRKATTT